MKPEIENLKVWMSGKSTTGYQRALGMREFEQLLTYVAELEQLRQPPISGSLPLPLIQWWEANRPQAWDLNEHLKFPSVNCPTKAEQELAMYVAQSYYGGNDR